MQNRIVWVLAALAAGSVVAAIGVGVNGYRNTPPPPGGYPAALNPLAAPNADADPLAPRLFERSETIRVHVAGAVRKPGVYSLPSYARVADAMKRAGGAASNADLDAINLADFLRDGEQLRIPQRGRPARLTAHVPTPEPPSVPPTVGGRGLGRYPFAHLAAKTAAAEAAGPINVNTATQKELESLPGIGPATAARIIAHRESYGSFLRPEDLMNVEGIGPARFERLRPLITVR